MSPLAVLFAATALAADPPHHAAKPDAAAAHQQKAYEQAVRHQMEQERRAMQHAVEQQQRAIHEQIKAQIQGQHHASSPYVAATPVAPDGYAGRPYASTHAHHYGYGYSHHRSYSNRYRHHRTWPTAQDPELAALQHLKRALDAVPMGHSTSSGHQSAIEHALMRVVEVPRWPSVASVNRLAGHVGHALAGRGSAAVDTTTLALMLRAGVNAPLLMNAERAEVVRDLEAALRRGGVRPEHVASVVAALKDVAHQELARR